MQNKEYVWKKLYSICIEMELYMQVYVDILEAVCQKHISRSNHWHPPTLLDDNIHYCLPISVYVTGCHAP